MLSTFGVHRKFDKKQETIRRKWPKAGTDSPRAARMPADQKTSPQRAGRKSSPPIREPYASWWGKSARFRPIGVV